MVTGNLYCLATEHSSEECNVLGGIEELNLVGEEF